MQGAVRWYELPNGLKSLSTPAVMQTAMDKYWLEQDGLGSFIQEWCILGEGLQCNAAEFRKDLNLFLVDKEKPPMRQNVLKKEMLERKFKYTSNPTGLYKGLRLKSLEEE